MNSFAADASRVKAEPVPVGPALEEFRFLYSMLQIYSGILVVQKIRTVSTM